jgi:hypothetical protein
MYPTKNQWSLASGLTDNFTAGSNSGDIPAPFVLKAPTYIYESSLEELTFVVGDLTIKVPAKTTTTTPGGTAYIHHYNIEWDSKTGIVSATVEPNQNSKRIPVLYTGDSLGAIPVDGLTEQEIDIYGATLDYDYWYY